jgi:predicted DNA-binding transcriptional regulator AlpA
MQTYSPVEEPRLIDATRISNFFGMPDSWFKRDRVRKALYARGFPLPVFRGRWLRSAVDAWLEREGKRSKHSEAARPKQTVGRASRIS